MKKILSLVMAISLMFGLGITGQANASEIKNNKITIKNLNQQYEISNEYTMPIILNGVIVGEKLDSQGNQFYTSIAISDIYGVKINANSEIEKYIANKLIAGETRFSLDGYPESKNVQSVMDIFCKVVYQNPLILGVENVKYDYDNSTIIVDYKDTKAVMAQKQQEILSEAKRIISITITPNMTDEQKRKALYDYLNKNTTYDNQALESAKQANFQSDDDKFEDSFTTYGVMVKKVGVCSSYANSYKLLCDLTGIDCIVVLGSFNNIAHAWNKVKIDNEWLAIDTTNSETNTGIPYMMYEGNDSELTELSYVANNKNYWIDSELGNFVGTTDKYEYYSSQGLVVNDIEQYKAKVSELIQNGQTKMSFKLGMINDAYVVKYATNEVLNKIAKDKLDSVNYSSNGKFIVIKIN